MKLHWRISAVILTFASVLAIAAAPAAADERNKDYLALGDSVAFGFNPLLPRANAANFVGYPDVVARDEELNLTNASCPGEATGGFISLTGVDNVCRPYRASFPLHVAYSSSQLDFAVSFLLRHPRTRLVTIDIGANDLFVLEKQCNNSPTCIQAGLPALFATVSANLSTILGRIRTDAHYHHDLVALTYYALNYTDKAGLPILVGLNRAIASSTQAAGAQVADGFGAFRTPAFARGAGDSCAAGLLIKLPTGGCDIHPSPAGRDLLAAAIEQALEGDDDAQVR
jgi:lysophospholipase L1-like esterase